MQIQFGRAKHSDRKRGRNRKKEIIHIHSMLFQTIDQIYGWWVCWTWLFCHIFLCSEVGKIEEYLRNRGRKRILTREENSSWLCPPNYLNGVEFFFLLFYSGLGPKKNTIHSELVLVCIRFAFGLQNDAEVHVFLWIHLKTSNASVYAMPWFMNILVRWCRRSFLSNILPEEWFNLWRKNRRRLAFNLCRSLRLKTVSIFILATYNTYRSNDFGV